MIQAYERALDEVQRAKDTIEQTIKDKFPIIVEMTIYNPRNMDIRSDTFSLDIYRSKDYTIEDINLNCNQETHSIPTEEEAVKRVRAMHQERTEFWLACEYLINLMKEEETN